MRRFSTALLERWRTAVPSLASSSVLSATAWLAIPVLAIVWIGVFSGATYDDAFIYYRYARNVVQGWGPVFNAHDPVEGFTGPLWLLIQVPGAWARIDPMLWAVSAAVIGHLGTLALLVHALRRAGRSRAAWIAGLLFCLFPANAFWAVSGLETSWTQMLLLLALVLLHREHDGPGRRILQGAVLGCLCLIRVEGPALVAVVGIFELERGLALPRHARARALGELAKGLVPFIAYLLLRHDYYGEWLPNTYFAKIGYGSAALERGRVFTRGFVEAAFSTRWFAALVLAHGLFFLRREKEWASYASLALIALGLGALSGGNNLPLWRYLMPAAPLLAWLQARFIDAMLVSAARQQRAWRHAVRVAAVVLVVFWSIAGMRAVFAAPPIKEYLHGNLSFYRWTRIIGTALREILEPEQSIAINAIPFVAYHYEGPALDMLGLVDRTIAHREMEMGRGVHGHEKGDGRYLLAQEPTLVLPGPGPHLDPEPNRSFPSTLYFVSEREMFGNPVGRALYEPADLRLGSLYLHFYRRRGERVRELPPESPLHEQARRAADGLDRAYPGFERVRKAVLQTTSWTEELWRF